MQEDNNVIYRNFNADGGTPSKQDMLSSVQPPAVVFPSILTTEDELVIRGALDKAKTGIMRTAAGDSSK